VYFTDRLHSAVVATAEPCSDELDADLLGYDTTGTMRSIGTPREAAEYVASRVSFSGGHDGCVTGCPDRWSSLTETLALGSGDCEDGAIAFAALLVDDFEYEVKVVALQPAPARPGRPAAGSGHAIAVFGRIRTGLWGWVSFNDWEGQKPYHFQEEKYPSALAAVAGFSGGWYDRYVFVELPRCMLERGRGLQERYLRPGGWARLE